MSRMAAEVTYALGGLDRPRGKSEVLIVFIFRSDGLTILEGNDNYGDAIDMTVQRV